jgi:hypothetical protein
MVWIVKELLYLLNKNITDQVNAEQDLIIALETP